MEREISAEIQRAAATRPALVLTGTRQTGKTSLLRRWNHPLEALLEQEWTSQTARLLTWDEVKADVKHGWEMARGAIRKPGTH